MGKLKEIAKVPGGGTQFEIEYLPPFAGLDTSAPDAYIRPNALLQIQNAVIIDNAYVAQSISQISSGPTNVVANIGIGDLDGTIFTVNLGNLGNLQIYSWPINPFANSSVPFLMGSFTVDAGVTPGPLTYININGVCYFSWAGADNIYQHNNTTAGVLTTYLGAAYLAELNGRLLAANVTQNVSGTLTNFPYQIAWSAAAGAYSQFNPLVGGLVTGAGFNNLPDVEDIITGMFTVGPTAYIVRRQGITEMSPLNSGIQPFDFNHLWASHKGIGTVYPQTLAQYGSLGAFVADDDIYTIGYDGINVISGFAKTALYSALVKTVLSPRPPVFQAILCPLLINGNPQLYYILMTGSIEVIGGFGNISGTMYLYNFTLKEWTTIGFNYSIPRLVGGNIFLASITGDQYTAYETPSLGIAISVNSSLVGQSFINFSTIPNSAWLDSVNGMTLTFPPEEISFGREVTVDGAILYMKGTVNTTVSVSITGKNAQDGSITTIALGVKNGLPIQITNTNWQIYKLWPALGRPVTLLYPQLLINSVASAPGTETLNIGKVSIFATFDPKQRVI